MGNRKREWTNKEIEIAKQMIDEENTWKEIGDELNRKRDDVKYKMTKLGYKSKKNSNNDYIYKVGEVVKGIKILSHSYIVRKDTGNKQKAYIALNLEHNIEIEIREWVLKESKSTSVFPKQYKKEVNSIKLKRPDLLKYLNNKKDQNKPLGSNDYIVVKCPLGDCSYKKEMEVYRLVQQGFNCKFCSDKTPFPQKVFSAYLDLNSIKYDEEVPLPNGMRIDFVFYVGEKAVAVEVNGNQHYSNSSNWGDTITHHKNALSYKKAYCDKNNMTLVEIDCRNSDIYWIKSNIVESGFEFLVKKISDDILFDKIKSKDNDTLRCVELYHQGMSIDKISKILGFSACKVTGILKRNIGYKPLAIGKCNQKKVRCITTGDVFNSVTEAKKWAIKASKIDAVCRGERKVAGKHPETGEKLCWEYV